MNEALKKLSAEVKARIEASLASKEWQDFFSKTKEAAESGTFEVVISTADIDRAGESITQAGMDTALYMKNPVVLWAHDYYALPIGICDSVELADDKLVAKGRFAPADANPYAQQVRKLYELGIIRATSVGFIVKEMEGNIITKAELLEFSFVPVPANPYALSLSQVKELGIELDMIAAKGLSLQTKDETPPADPQPTPPAPETPPAEPQPTPPAEPAATPPAEPEKKPEEEQKGAIGEEVSAQDMWEQKWQKLNPILDVIDALLNVYLDDKTPVADFEKLLEETIAILKALVPTGTASAAEIAKAIASRAVARAADPKAVKNFTLRAKAVKTLQAIGAEVAAMQTEIDTSMSAHSINILDICRDYGMPETPSGEAAQPQATENAAVPDTEQGRVGEETPSGASPKTVDPKGADAGKEFNDFQAVRALLRAAATATGQALERMNERASSTRKTR